MKNVMKQLFKSQLIAVSMLVLVSGYEYTAEKTLRFKSHEAVNGIAASINGGWHHIYDNSFITLHPRGVTNLAVFSPPNLNTWKHLTPEEIAPLNNGPLGEYVLNIANQNVNISVPKPVQVAATTNTFEDDLKAMYYDKLAESNYITTDQIKWDFFFTYHSGGSSQGMTENDKDVVVKLASEILGAEAGFALLIVEEYNKDLVDNPENKEKIRQSYLDQYKGKNEYVVRHIEQ